MPATVELLSVLPVRLHSPTAAGIHGVTASSAHPYRNRLFAARSTTMDQIGECSETPRPLLRDDEDLLSDDNVREQPLGVGDVHANAAVGKRVADRARFGRAVNADSRSRQAH